MLLLILFLLLGLTYAQGRIWAQFPRGLPAARGLAALTLLLLTAACNPPGAASTSAASASVPLPQPRTEPVKRLLQKLLDTAAAGSASATDSLLGLQAGPEVRAFYSPQPELAWVRPQDSITRPAAPALALLARAAAYGLTPVNYHYSRLQALRDSLAAGPSPGHGRRQALLELYLTDAVLTFMRDLTRGRLRPYTVSAGERAAGRVRQPVADLRAALTSGSVTTALLAGQPTNREYRQLQQALARWLARPRHPDSAAFYRAQFELAALNLERWRWEALPADSAYIFINLPAYELQVVVGDSVRRRHRVIVGKPASPTPTLSSRIRYFTLAPEWRVPHSIATKEMLPRLRADAGYLTRNGLTLYDERGQLLDPYTVDWQQVTARHFSYSIRQAAGCDNALGNIVFRFANPYAVYLHDTPLRQFFARPDRALSHGCVRVEKPLQLAAYLLRREGRVVTLPSEAECARQPQPHDVRLRCPLPLHIRYATCVAEQGRLRALPDVYQQDEPLRRALFGPAAQPRPATFQATPQAR